MNQYLKLIFLALVLCPVSWASAAPLIPTKKTFQVSDSEGKKFRCTETKKGKIYVVKKGKGYITGAAAIAELKSKVNAASGASKKKLKKQLANLQNQVKDRNKVCNGDSSDPSNPNVPKSLEKLTRALTEDDIINLVDKAGFGMGADEERLVNIGLNQGVDALVDEFMSTRTEPSGLLDRVNDRLDGEIGKNQTQTPSGQRQAILDLWIHTHNPYAERLAMALLGIWTVSGEVVEDETFRSSSWDYYSRLRTYAFDQTNIPAMGVEITRDPLMLLFLNNDVNMKGAFNENYARELMELFTLGPIDLDGQPNYTETALDGTGDILTAAKILTGWTVKKDYIQNKLVAQYDPTRHEPGSFTMFPGKSWSFSASSYDELVQGILLHHPAAKNYYASELLKLYLTPNPPRELVEAFGAVIAANNFNIRPAMRTLFVSGAFYDNAFKDTVPSDPFLMSARVARTLRMDNAINIGELQRQTAKMGFTPNFPPSVFWYPQSAWGSSSILLEKANLIAQIMADHTAQDTGGWAPSKVLPTGAASIADVIDFARKKSCVGSINQAQTQSLTSFMSTQLQYDGKYTPYNYDNTKPLNQKEKGLGVYFLLFMSPKFQLL